MTLFPIRAWEQPEPGPRGWAIPGLIPDRATTILYGDAGIAKTWLALLVATCTAAGVPCLGEAVERRTVLFADAELDATEFISRAYKIARGLGMASPPEGLHYVRLTEPLTDVAATDAVGDIVRSVGAGLTILDSLSVAAAGADLAAPAAMTRLMQSLRGWGTIFALDHSAKPQPGVNTASLRPFGSQFKFAMARSVIQMVAAESGRGFVLRPSKSNFGARGQPIGAGIAFEDDVVRFTRAGIDSEELDGIETQLPAVEQVARALARHPDGVHPQQIAVDTDTAEKTCRNHLSTLRQQGRAEALGDGRWRPSIPDS